MISHLFQKRFIVLGSLYSIAFTALLAALGGWILEILNLFPGCILCHIQRWMLLTGSFLTFSCIFFLNTSMGKKMLGVTILMWTAQSLTGFYHTTIQYGFIQMPKFCQVIHVENQQGTLDEKLDAFLSSGSKKPQCSQRTLDIWGVPGALYLGIVSALWAWMCWMIRRSLIKKNSKESNV